LSKTPWKCNLTFCNGQKSSFQAVSGSPSIFSIIIDIEGIVRSDFAGLATNDGRLPRSASH
jgi:hypothetical protein